MTFLQQLSAEADAHDEQSGMNSTSAYSFKQGVRWALQSELVKELAAALAGMVESHEICMEVYKDMPLTLGCFNGSFLNEANKARQALQKLTEARGNL